MADYYPLLAKAVAALPDPTPQARRAIYERARNALVGQLRRLDPPVPEVEIDRESSALEVAVARLEAEFAPPEPDRAAPEPIADLLSEAAPVENSISMAPAAIDAPGPPPGPPPSQPEPESSIEPASSEPPVALAPASPPEAAPGETKTQEPPAGPPPPRAPMFFKVQRDKSPLFPSAPRPNGFSARQPASATPGLRSHSSAPPPVSQAKPPESDAVEPQVRENRPPDASFGGTAEHIGNADASEAPSPDARFDETNLEGSEALQSLGAGTSVPSAVAPDAPDAGADLSQGEWSEQEEPFASPRISPALAKPRSDAQRPFAPQPPRDHAAPRRLWAVGFVVGLLVFLVAIAAFELRDRPEELRQKAAAPVIVPEAASNGKIVDRVNAGPDASEPAPAPSSDTAAAPPRASAASSAAPASDQAAPSARRAALLVEAPDEQSKVKTYLGAVVWKVDNVSEGPGDPLSMAVHAEVDIPEEKLQAIVTLQKNFDSSLPASHTMKVQFVEPADSPLGGVQQIGVPQMRREEVATGDALKGVPVSISDNSFLVGLTRGPSEEEANLDLLKSREWIDVPMILSNGKIAKLTFEKGPAGDRAIEDALASWNGQ